MGKKFCFIFFFIFFPICRGMSDFFGSSSSPMFYHCGTAKVQTSWTDCNPGRRFWGCEKYSANVEDGCGFFHWIDPPMCARSKAIIPGLLRRIHEMERRLEKLEDGGRMGWGSHDGGGRMGWGSHDGGGRIGWGSHDDGGRMGWDFF